MTFGCKEVDPAGSVEVFAKTPGWLGYITDEQLPSYVDYFIKP